MTTTLSVIDTNTPYNIPGDFADLHAAYDSLKSTWINWDVNVTFNLGAGSIASGTHVYTTDTLIKHPQGGNIKIVGATPIVINLINIDAVSGSAGNWTVTAHVSDTSNITALDLIKINTDTEGAVLHELHRGAWEVLSVVDSTHITLKNTCRNQTPPTGVFGTMTVYPTQVKYNGCNGLCGGLLGGIDNVAMKSDGTGNFGILGRDAYHPYPAIMIIGNILINGFGADGIRANYCGATVTNGATISNCANNGGLARDTANARWDNTVFSGNGRGLFAGGGNGALAQCSSASYVFQSESYGNYGAGFYARTASCMLHENTNPSKSVGNNIGLYATYESYHQANSAYVHSNPSGNTAATSSADVVASPLYTTPSMGETYVTVYTGNPTSAGGVDINGYNTRFLLPGALFANNFKRIRITIAPHASYPANFSGMYIGPKASSGDAYDFATTPVALTFGGATSMTMAAGSGDHVLDELPISGVAGQDLLVSLAIGGSTRSSYNSYTGGAHYWKAANAAQAATADVSGYNTDLNLMAWVRKVEVVL